MRIFILLCLITLLFISCGKNISNYCDQEIVGNAPVEVPSIGYEYPLDFKGKDGGVERIYVNKEDYDFYKVGDTVECN